MVALPPCSVLLDLVSLAAAGLPILLVKYLATPTQNGFFCSDLSLRHPFHHSTVPTYMNMSLSYGLPLLIILSNNLTKRLGSRQRSFKTTGSRLWTEVKCFLFGVLTTQMISGVAKQLCGRLRPHFVTVCNPSPSLSTAECGSLESPNYLTNFTCLGNSDVFPDPGVMEKYRREARLSFPSGHASLASYGMLYAVLYLQWQTCLPRAAALPRAVLQALLLLYAIGCCISRVTDFKHHPTDVLAGAVLGCSLALAAVSWGNRQELRSPKKRVRSAVLGPEVVLSQDP